MGEWFGCGDNGFLLLIALFILLASDVTKCKENNFFFIIILAVIGLGGMNVLGLGTK